jgi:hypothetical protein
MNASFFENVLKAMEDERKHKAELGKARVLVKSKQNAFLDLLQPILIRSANAYNEAVPTLMDAPDYLFIVTDDIVANINWPGRAFTLILSLKYANGEAPFRELLEDDLQNVIFQSLQPFIIEEFDRENIPLKCLGVRLPSFYFFFKR